MLVFGYVRSWKVNQKMLGINMISEKVDSG